MLDIHLFLAWIKEETEANQDYEPDQNEKNFRLRSCQKRYELLEFKALPEWTKAIGIPPGKIRKK